MFDYRATSITKSVRLFPRGGRGSRKLREFFQLRSPLTCITITKYQVSKCPLHLTGFHFSLLKLHPEQCLNEYSNMYIRIFKYFPTNIDIHIQFVVILKAEYYSNIQIFCPNISEYWSLKIRSNAGIKDVLFSFFT